MTFCLAGCGHDSSAGADGPVTRQSAAPTTGQATPPAQAPTTGAGTTSAPGGGHPTLPAPSVPASPSSTSPPQGSGDGDAAGTPKNQNAVLDNLPGSRAPGCVTVGGLRDVRSGSVAMGNFEDARADYLASKGAYDADPLNFYVVPQSVHVSKVSVTFTPLSAQATARTVTSTAFEMAGRWKYFSVQFAIPSPGTWRISAVAGAQQGCFDVTFTA